MSSPSPQRRRLELAGAGAVDPAPADGAERVRLRFLPEGAEVRVPSGTPVFDAASWNGIAIDSTCGGHGTCKKCRVRIVSGEVPVGPLDPRAFSVDELHEGWRLACRASARGDLVVEVPPLQTRPKAALAGVGRHVILRPAVQKRHLVLTEPTMEDQRSDLQRVLDALDDLEPHASIEVLRSLGRVLRESGFDVTAVVADQELIALEPGDTSERRFAIAFDLGTTTVVATLLDLESGQPVAVRSMLNRQQPLRRGRDHADLGDDDGPRGTRRAAVAGPRDDDRAGRRGLRRRVGRCARGVRDHRVRQRDDDASGARDRSRAAVDGAVRGHDPLVRRSARARLRSRGAPAGAGVRVPVAGRLRRRGHRGRDAGHRPHARSTAAAVHRRRHEQRDRARIGRSRGRDRGAGGSGVRGRADPLRHAGRRRARSRA